MKKRSVWIWIALAALLALEGRRLSAQGPEAAVEQSMRGYAAALKGSGTMRPMASGASPT